MFYFFETVLALLSAYGVVFFLWWIMAIVFAGRITTESFFTQKSQIQTYINWLKFAGIFPPAFSEEGQNDTRTNDN